MARRQCAPGKSKQDHAGRSSAPAAASRRAARKPGVQGAASLAEIRRAERRAYFQSDECRRLVDEAGAKISRCIDEGHELWRACVGRPMPLDHAEMAIEARRADLSPDAVLAGDFTLGDVTMLMVGKRLAAADAASDRARAAAAEEAARRNPGAVTLWAGGSGGHRPADSPPDDRKLDAQHSDDFASVVWYGTAYHFSRMQAACVQALWTQWDRSPGLGLRSSAIFNSLESSIDRDRFRVPLVFRHHPAWGTMIVSAGKGMYKLEPPQEKPDQSRKLPRRKINATSTHKRR